jgi:hypothetical protein
MSEYDFSLAEEVIHEACEQRDPVTMAAPFEAVIWRRWPATKGGIGFAHARTRANVRASIREFYAPRDWSPEPTGDIA